MLINSSVNLDIIEIMKKPRNTTGKGYFTVDGPEPLSKKALHVRLPESRDAEVRELAGDKLSEWLREAIVEKIEREKQREPA